MKILNIIKRYFTALNILLFTAFLLGGAKELWQTEVLIFILLVLIYDRIFREKGHGEFVANKRYLVCLAIFAVFLAASFIFSIDFSRSLENSYRFVLFFMMLFILVHFNDESSFKNIFEFIVLLSAANSTFIILQHSAHLPGLSSGFLEGNPTYSALLNSMALIIITMKWVGSKDGRSEEKIGRRRFLSKRFICEALVILIILYASVILNSRVFYLFSVFLISAIIYMRFGLRYALLFLLSCAILYSTLPDHVTKTGARNYGRWLIWLTAVKSLAFRPIAGVGMWNFKYLYELNKLPDYFSDLSYAHSGNFAHNDILQLGVELGVVFFVLILWLLIKFGLYFLAKIRGFRAGYATDRDLNTVISLFCIMAYLIYLSFNFVVYHTMLILLLAVPVSYIIISGGRTGTNVKARRYIFAVLLLLNIPALSIIAADYFAHIGMHGVSAGINPYDAENIMKSINSNAGTVKELRQNVLKVNAAGAVSPFNKHIRIAEARAYIDLDRVLREEGRGGEYTGKAVHILKENMVLFPSDCISSNLLGRIYITRGSYLEALRMFSYSIDRERYYADSIFFSAVCFAEMGMVEKAVEILNGLIADKDVYEAFNPMSGYGKIVTNYDVVRIIRYRDLLVKKL